MPTCLRPCPESHEATEHINQALIDVFPESVGLTVADTTFSAMKKIHLNLRMPAMQPKS